MIEATYPLEPTTPKYDPCRKFRKGDIVEPSEINGRLPQELLGCYRYEVITGEGEMSSPLYVKVKPLLSVNYKHLSDIHVNAVFLKLVTPVEDLESYYVEDVGNAWCVRKPEPSDMYSTQAWFSKERHPHAKAAAEAERDRLNAESRKEKK